MESKAKILGHPIHPILIVFPLGLLATSVIFDIVGLVSQVPRWAEFAARPILLARSTGPNCMEAGL